MTDEEFRALFEGLGQRIDSLGERLDGRIDSLEVRFEDFRRYSGISFEAVRSDIRGLAEAIAAVDEKHDRNYQRLEKKVDAGFEETHALIKFSYNSLDTRVTALEKRRRR